MKVCLFRRGFRHVDHERPNAEATGGKRLVADRWDEQLTLWSSSSERRAEGKGHPSAHCGRLERKFVTLELELESRIANQYLVS